MQSISDHTSIPRLQDLLMWEVNGLFSRFNNAYDDLFGHYCRLKKDTDYDYRTTLLNFRLLVEGKKEEEFVHPKYMREFLGGGMVPSYLHPADLKPGAAMDKGEGKLSHRVGKVLSWVHNEIRNTGKIWGQEFDEGRLDFELRVILNYIDDKMLGKRDDIAEMTKHIKGCLKVNDGESDDKIRQIVTSLIAKSDEEISDDLMARFGRVKNVPLTRGREITGNPSIEVKERNDEADPPITEIRHVPLAAIAWAVRPAGMFLQGRPDGPMKKFLLEAFGIGNEAGKKMDALHQHAPDVFLNYDLDKVREVIDDQAHWLLVAQRVSSLIGLKDPIFRDLVDAAEVQYGPPNSAYKIAVLLYALVERVNKEKPLMPEYQESLQDLGEKLAAVGAVTEKKLDELKIVDSLRGDKIIRDYKDEYNRIMYGDNADSQKSSLKMLLQNDANKYLDALKAVKEVAYKLSDREIKEGTESSMAKETYERIAYFCLSHFPHKVTAMQPHSNGRQK